MEFQLASQRVNYGAFIRTLDSYLYHSNPVQQGFFILVARNYLSFSKGNKIQIINKYTNCNKIFFCNINKITFYYGTIDIEILFGQQKYIIYFIYKTCYRYQTQSLFQNQSQLNLKIQSLQAKKRFINQLQKEYQINTRQMLQKIDMAMYQQMGFNKQQVRKAAQYAQVKKIDIFDALQLIQKQQATYNSRPKPSSFNSPPQRNSEGSLLSSFKNINLNDYEILFSKKASRMSLTGKKFDLRQQTSPVGLLNVYNCCYLNSLLQCYFLSTDLIKYILQAQPITITQQLQEKMGKIKVKRIQNQFNLLYTLKDIFGRMCLTSKKYIDPTQVLKNLVDSVGEKIEFGQQKDLFETNIMIIERLNQCLLYTKKYFKPQLQLLDKSSISQTTNQSFLSASERKSTQPKNYSPTKSLINKTRIRQKDNIKRLFYGQKIQYTDPIVKNEPVQQTLSDFLGIIVNPAYQNLYRALYEEFHYDVEIQTNDKKYVKTKKHTYIRQAPEYMYFYINRTGYDAQEKHALKNQQKLSFDFVIYLDRFLEKYKQQAQQNTPLVIELWKRKNQLRKKLNNFQIFAKKLQECRLLALEQWKQKLPNEAQIQKQRLNILQQLKNLQSELQKIQSRKQKYCLMYIFSHRGDAVSGHYWGYGKNGDKWYKFDINTKQMKQQEILLDLYKCGGTPYALVYVTEKHIPKFKYSFHTKFTREMEEADLIDMGERIQQAKKVADKTTMVNPYISYIPHGIKKIIISQNLQLHQQYTKRRNFQITVKTIKQYLTRYNYLSVQFQQINKKSQNSFRLLPSYDNFAMYLWTMNQLQLAKYNIFAVSFRLASTNMTTKTLVQTNQTLLAQIQKQFKKKAKKNKTLKHFCIWYEPKQSQKYSQLHRNYIVQKQSFLLLLRMIKYIQDIENLKKQNLPIPQQIQNKINEMLKRIAIIKNVSEKKNCYIKCILAELTSVFLLKFVVRGGKLKMNQAELNILLSNAKLVQQLKILDLTLNKSASLNGFSSGGYLLSQKQYYQAPNKKNYNGQQIWNSQDIGKGPNRTVLEKRFSSITSLINTQVKIYKRVQKQGIFSMIDPKTNQVVNYIEQKPMQTNKVEQQSLI